jgi:hypothetical protein
MSWIACCDDACQTHLSEKDGAGYWPKAPKNWEKVTVRMPRISQGDKPEAGPWRLPETDEDLQKELAREQLFEPGLMNWRVRASSRSRQVIEDNIASYLMAVKEVLRDPECLPPVYEAYIDSDHEAAYQQTIVLQDQLRDVRLTNEALGQALQGAGDSSVGISQDEATLQEQVKTMAQLIIRNLEREKTCQLCEKSREASRKIDTSTQTK